VEVTNTKKREPDREYVKETPYKTTTVTDVAISPSLHVEKVTVDRPSPGTPPDALYAYPTAPSAKPAVKLKSGFVSGASHTPL
jgi:hypothetical protein